MRHILLIFILSLIPLSAQAIIPLELVAEFNLPENATAWDVQHWMDDSTFGWAAIVGDSILWQQDSDSPVNYCTIPTSFFTESSMYRSFQMISILRLESYANRLTTAITALETLQDGDVAIHYTFDVIVDLEDQTALTWERHYCGRCNPTTDGHCTLSTPTRLTAWPPPPAFASRIVTSYDDYDDYEGPGSDYHEWTSSMLVYQVDSANIRRIKSASLGYFDIFEGEIFDLALSSNDLRSTWDYDYYSAHIGYYSSIADTVTVREICYGYEMCGTQLAIAYNLENAKLIIANSIIHDAVTFTEIDTLDFRPSFAMRPRAGEQSLLWTLAEDKYILYDIHGELIDSTSAIEGYNVEIVKQLNGTGFLQRILYSPRRVLIYEPYGQASSPENQKPTLPTSFALYVYPNPFNATTSLKIEVSRAGFYDILLFDVTGRQVAKLFSGRIDSQQTIAVNAEQFSSGVYFAQLRSGESSLAATKLLLLK